MKIIRDKFNYVHSTRCSVPAGMFYNVARVIKYARRFFLCRCEEDERKAKRVAEVFLWYEKLKMLEDRFEEVGEHVRQMGFGGMRHKTIDKIFLNHYDF